MHAELCARVERGSSWTPCLHEILILRSIRARLTRAELTRAELTNAGLTRAALTRAGLTRHSVPAPAPRQGCRHSHGEPRGVPPAPQVTAGPAAAAPRSAPLLPLPPRSDSPPTLCFRPPFLVAPSQRRQRHATHPATPAPAVSPPC